MGFGLIKVVNKKMEFLQLNELILNKYDDHYMKLKVIFERTIELIDTHHPDEIAIDTRTEGIQLDIWKDVLPNVKVNIWDFGGQEILQRSCC